jgi:hypothetical protein
MIKLKGPKCSICKSYVDICLNPWQRTRTYACLAIRSSLAVIDVSALLFWYFSDLIMADISDDSENEPEEQERPPKLGKHGIELRPCKHVFCGVSLLFQYVEMPN